MSELSHLDELEAEAIYIIREVAAECEKPVMLYSIGKDSSVMLHLAMKAFYPEKPPFPFMHIDTTWKFKDMIKFRDDTAKKLGIEMIVYSNEEGIKQGINPFDHGAAYTDIMKTQALKQALTKYGFTAAFGGGRRDEEKSRAKERIFSFRNEAQAWDPKNQRPEMWKLYNTKINKGESMRVFPISNWTEKDIWQYIKREKIDIVPLYFAAKRPVVERDGKDVKLKVKFNTEDYEGHTYTVMDFWLRGVKKTPANVISQTGKEFVSYARMVFLSLHDLLVGRYGISDMSGPVGAVSVVSTAVKTSMYSMLRIMALLTVNVGLFNLFPIPALDGWRLFVLLAEGITRKKLPQKAEYLINAVGLAALLLLMCFVTFSDITKLF